jgi:sarcosine oxidase subunit gamma
VTAERATARAPLEARAADLAGLGARELPFLGKVDVRLDPREAPGRFGLAAPTSPNTWTAEGEREWLWLGPDEWLVLGPPGSATSTARELRAALGGIHHGLVDVSAGLAAIELGGERRHDLLASGCGLDLHPRSWGPGRCAQTLAGRYSVLLQEREGATRLFVRPSYAGSLVDWLLAVS